MLNVNDKLKVHLYDSHNREIKTRNYDVIFTVYKKDGKLGINWNTELQINSENVFVPFKSFSHTVIFENVENGKSYHWDYVKNCIVEIL